MKKKAIILDIDNTIFSQAKRINKVYNTVTNKNNIFDGNQNLEKGINLIESLRNTPEYNLFYSIFLGDQYYKNDNKYYIELIKNADTIINEIFNKGIEIFYVSARINNTMVNHFPITFTTFNDFNIPYKKENIKLLNLDYIPQDTENFHEEANKFKTDMCKEINKNYSVLFGLGDAKSDIDAFINANIKSIQARFVIPRNRFYDKADHHISDWNDLKKFY